MNAPKKTIQGLGEIALRVADLGRMQNFYEQIIGLIFFWPASKHFATLNSLEGSTPGCCDSGTTCA